MPSHQFYLALAVAPAVSFQESWHFYLQACRGAGTRSEIRCELNCESLWSDMRRLLCCVKTEFTL